MYQIIQTDTREEMVDAVNAAMEGGWRPCGGCAYAERVEEWTDEDGYTDTQTVTRYVQAMTRELPGHP